MRTYIPTAAVADGILKVYADNLDTPITDRELVDITGFTPSQIARGKTRLREVVASDENFMYVVAPGRNGGSYLTHRTEPAATYVRDRSKVWAKQLDMVRKSTLQELGNRDPNAILIARQFDRLIEDLHFVTEVA